MTYKYRLVATLPEIVTVKRHNYFIPKISSDLIRDDRTEEQRQSQVYCELRTMVDVAQLVESGVVSPVVAGSSPVVHPII